MKALRSLFVAITLVLGAIYSLAQTTSATLTGAVSDPSGAAIPGASVVAENLQTHVRVSAVTN